LGITETEEALLKIRGSSLPAPPTPAGPLTLSFQTDTSLRLAP